MTDSYERRRLADLLLSDAEFEAQLKREERELEELYEAVGRLADRVIVRNRWHDRAVGESAQTIFEERLAKYGTKPPTERKWKKRPPVEVGKTYGERTVIRQVGNKFLARCKCGSEKLLTSTHIRVSGRCAKCAGLMRRKKGNP